MYLLLLLGSKVWSSFFNLHERLYFLFVFLLFFFRKKIRFLCTQFSWLSHLTWKLQVCGILIFLFHLAKLPRMRNFNLDYRWLDCEKRFQNQCNGFEINRMKRSLNISRRFLWHLIHAKLRLDLANRNKVIRRFHFFLINRLRATTAFLRDAID